MNFLNKCGISKCNDNALEQDFINYKNANIDFMEIRASDYATENVDKLIEYQNKYGVKINSVHLQFSKKIDISNPNPEISNETFKLHSYYIEKLHKLAKIFVLHPSAEPIANEDRKLYLDTAIKNIKKLADVAEKHNAIIAVENLPRTCLGSKIDEFKRLISCDNRLRVCFDVNHLLYDLHADFISNFGDKIITTHISDYDFIDERHLLPGEGKIDWKELFKNLQKVNYTGPILFELEPYSTIRVNRPINLTTENFRSVYEAIVTLSDIPVYPHELLF